MDQIISEIHANILEGDINGLKTNVQAALDLGIPASLLLNEGMIDAMTEVGHLFESGEYFIPEMLVSAHAMQAGLTLLEPHLKNSERTIAGKVVIGAVKGDLHDIGKNLVAIMLEGIGFEVIDLGTDVPPEKFVNALHEHDAHILALSALLTTTMPSIKVTIDALNAAGLHGKVKVMIGGAPITQAYADQVGADGFAPDASRAVVTAKELMASIS